MPSSIDDIKEQEEDIFEDLSCYDLSSLNDVSIGELYPAGESAQVVSCTAKNQARKQLAVSEDSPFSHIGNVQETGEVRRFKEEKAARLREETDQIKRQLDIVKRRLNELKGNCTPKNDTNGPNEGRQKIEPKKGAAGSQQSDSTPLGPHRVHEPTLQATRPTATVRLTKQSEPKFRPLTGKTDCPNCTCDRRSSVCDRCISFAIMKPTMAKSKLSEGQTVSLGSRKAILYDDRPIRPAKGRLFEDQPEIEVEGSIVPNRVYTISKSLNDKRTKLAQAIDELNTMMDQVKEKSNKLEQERKLVQLYKDQWKFGPTIGGPVASPRDRLATEKKQHQLPRSYESRHDPNLKRDSKSLMGFQHVGAGMRLRNYDNTNRRVQASKTRIQPTMHSRSKSLESLKTSGKRYGDTSGSGQPQRMNQASKSSSELAINKSAKINDPDEDLEEVAEELEGEIRDNGDERPDSDRHPSRVSPPIEVAVESGLVENDKNLGTEKVKRMTWIPVFGETEIKTIKRDLPKRKIQIVTPDSQAAQNQHNNVYRRLPSRTNSNLKSALSHSPSRSETVNKCNSNGSQKATGNVTSHSSRIMLEAQRKLKACSNLLEQEQRDAASKNQLIINRTTVKPTPKPRLAMRSPPSRVADAHPKRPQACESNEQESPTGAVSDTSREIARLEEMVNEQQRLLVRLAQAQERPAVSPIMVSCSSPCCHHHASSPSKASGVSAPHRLISNPSNSRSLINTLRDRLNKSRLRLARKLEEEREKHQQLEQKVDSSLRKQSDLENENELLKKSLSKCIDTCLRDISNTFESLSDTLDGIGNNKNFLDDGDRAHAGQSSGAMLTNAAQLIADNRHLKQMRAHIEAIESQRKAIFDELSKEKNRSNQLESQLKESHKELSQLREAKQRLESRIALVSDEQSDPPPPTSSGNLVSGHKDANNVVSDSATSNQQQSTLNNLSSQTDTTEKSDTNDTCNSVDVYRRYIQSMSPDIESLKRERMVILSEFDNIKKMLSDIDN